MQLWLDLETYSPTPITNGSHKYAEQAEVMLFAWAIDDGPIDVWDVTAGGAAPRLLIDAINDPAVEVWAHNSHFDRTVLGHAMRDARPPLSRWRDTMVQAMAHGLPGKLAELCEVLKLPTDKAKDKAGKALINLFCKPIPFKFPHKREAFGSKAEYELEKALAEAQWPGRATRETHPAEWQRFIEYATLDIAAMREVHRIMPMWNYRGAELALWHLDQQINDRGVCIDVELAECAVNAVDLAQEGLREQTVAATGGQVESATKRDQLLAHILEVHGVDLPDMQKATLERRIADPDLPEGVKELLRLRLQTATTSTSKYKTLIRCTSSDGRLRGLLQFNGASRTGRWAGRLWQPQNLPSRGLLPQDAIMEGIEALKGGYAHLTFPDVMHLTSSAIRGCIVASPGKKLVVADLSNIEGRDQAWLAGESWKLKAFRDFDAGTGFDLYAMAYAKSFNVTPESVMADKKAGGSQRQVGKVQELALGYEGGVGAFVTFAAAYSIDLDELAEKAVKFIPGDVWGQANIMLQWHRDKGRDPAAQLKMPDRTWLVCESFKIGWRSGHKAIAAYWKELDACVREAIDHPGTTIDCGKVRIRRDGAWLRIVLPSGRAICYPSPQLVAEKKKRKDEAETIGLEALESEEAPTGRTKITYMGVNQYTRKWDRLDSYGGKIFENICQAVARDVMAHNMPAIEVAGYAIVLTVHDEILAEAPDSPEYNAEHLAALLATNPPWALDMPLAAAGFETYRYKKD